MRLSDRPVRIVHIFGQLERGGAELRTIELLRASDRRHYNMHFVSLSGRKGSLDEVVRGEGGTVHHIKLDLSFGQRFRQLLCDNHIDVVHSHVHYTSGLLLRLAAQAHVPIRIAHFRTSFDGRRNTLLRRLQRALLRHWIDRHATHILAVSRSAMVDAWGTGWLSDQRCRVIYNGIDLQNYLALSKPCVVRREFGLPDTCPLYIHVGRMAPMKNHLRLPGIFAAIAEQDPAARMLLVGRPSATIAQQLRENISAHRLTDRVVVAGERTDVPRLLRAADTMIFPSLWEGLPGVVLEACAAGTPVLGSSLGVMQEIAERMPSVHPLSLNDDDGAWARVARALCSIGRSDGFREAIASRFVTSGLTVQHSLEQLAEIWRGEVRTC